MSNYITIYADYVCPYCLLVENVVRGMIKGKDISIRWRPFELRPHPVPTLRIEDPYLPDIWKRSVYPMAKRLGIPIKLPSISPQPRTEKAFQVFAMAEDNGLGDNFTMAVMKAFFQKGKDIGNNIILADIAAEIGLERDAVLIALAKGSYSDRHLGSLQHAVNEVNISSVPTIIVGNHTFKGIPIFSELEKAIGDMEVI